MGARRRLIVLSFLSLALSSATACKPREEAAPPAPAPSSSAQSSADHLAKGEIPEGSERAFTLPLPLHSTIKAKFAGSVHVASTYTQEELANFVRMRVKDGKSSSGASETVFDRVVAIKDPSKTLTIQVRPAPNTAEYRSQMVINDVTPAPEESGMTDADRWKKAGMSPDGKLLDRKNLQ